MSVETNVSWVLTCSDSASRGESADLTGPVIIEFLQARGHDVHHELVSDDEKEIALLLERAVQQRAPVVVCTGGTGIGPRDVTPEAIRLVCDKELPGFGEALRSQRDRIPTADLSRALAAVAGRTLVIGLPGSTGGVHDGLAVLDRWLDHAQAMLAGADHGPRPSHSHSHSHSHSQDQPGDPDITMSAAVPPGCEVVTARVSEAPLNAVTLTESVRTDEYGAVVTFEGRVRDNDHGRDVVSLSYEAHPHAQATLAEILADVASSSAAGRLSVAHRYGPLPVGELAFFVAVSSRHRGAAFETAARVVDEVKDRLPIWKHQEFSDGTKEWVNCA